MKSSKKLLSLFSALLILGCASENIAEIIKWNLDTGDKLYSMKKIAEAQRNYENAIRLDPDNIHALIGLGNTAREQGNMLYAQAHTSYVRSMEARTDEDQKMGLKLVQELDNKATTQHNVALGSLSKALKLDPGNSQAIYGLGLLYYERVFSPFFFPNIDPETRVKERDIAINYFKQVIEKDPYAYLSFKYLSLALVTKGEIKEALHHLRKFRELLTLKKQEVEKDLSGFWPKDITDKLQKEIDDYNKQLNEIDDLIKKAEEALSSGEK